MLWLSPLHHICSSNCPFSCIYNMWSVSSCFFMKAKPSFALVILLSLLLYLFFQLAKILLKSAVFGKGSFHCSMSFSIWSRIFPLWPVLPLCPVSPLSTSTRTRSSSQHYFLYQSHIMTSEQQTDYRGYLLEVSRSSKVCSFDILILFFVWCIIFSDIRYLGFYQFSQIYGISSCQNHSWIGSLHTIQAFLVFWNIFSSTYLPTKNATPLKKLSAVVLPCLLYLCAPHLHLWLWCLGVDS